MADGTEVIGLTRRRDGRWRVSATDETFVEPDERLAVARFHSLVVGQEKRQVALAVETAGITFEQAISKATERSVSIQFQPGGTPAVSRLVDENEFWGAVRKLILEKPKYVAQMTGIEQIGYLTDLKCPVSAPTLKEIGELYANKTGLSPNQSGRSKLFWREFERAVGGKLVTDIDHDAVTRYERQIEEGSFAAKTVLHRYGMIRTVLAHAIRRGKGVKECRHALDVLAMLEIRDAHSLNPCPITPVTFWTICRQAVQAGDSVFVTLMLTALNTCMYSSEVAALRWDEVNLNTRELSTKRSKTGVPRIARLWPETVKLLKFVDRRGDHIFNTSHRSYTTFSVLDKFRRYRDAAEVEEKVKFSMIRDAAFSVACSATSLEATRALAGHRLPGVTDYYLQRNVHLVSAACDAVRKAFIVASRRGAKSLPGLITGSK